MKWGGLIVGVIGGVVIGITAAHVYQLYFASAAPGGTTGAESASAGVQPETVEAGSWERMRQCSAQAERVVGRDRAEGRSFGISVMSWLNHYSSKYERCFVQVFYHHKEAEEDRRLPLITYALVDAFTNRQLASCTDAATPAAENFCWIADDVKSSGCGACRAFVKDRMSEY